MDLNARICAALLVALALAAPAAAAAQNGDNGWESVYRAPRDSETATDMAVVTNADGHSVSIYRGAGDVVRGIFRLGEDPERFEDGNCPTVRIDRLPPHALVHLDGPCELDDPAVHFTLGVVSNEGKLQSTVLWQLMNGSGFRIWYHVKGRGYREAVFSLKRSMNALVGAVGPDVEVVP